MTQVLAASHDQPGGDGAVVVDVLSIYS